MIPILFAVFLLSGCVESTFDVPYPAGEKPSPVWSQHPQTRGWDSVHVEYYLLTYGGVDAHVRSGDGKHHFVRHGSRYYLDAQGNSYCDYDLGRHIVFTFDGRSEQYVFHANPTGGQTLMLLADPPYPLPATPPSCD